jgi:hypothetical protein
MQHEDYDPETNIAGGWFCEACDVFIHDSEVDHSDELYNEDKHD